MGKVIINITISTFCFFLLNAGIAQVFTIEGYAFLELQNNHTGIKVEFNRIAPSPLLDSVFTDNQGSYSIELDQGIYNVNFSKSGYIDIDTIETPVYDDIILEDQTLETIGLSGNLSGQISSGIYKVGGNITISADESLTLEAGTVLRFKQDVMFEVFGELIAEGTVDDSIKFTHYEDSSTWMGIDFKENSTNESIIKYCVIEYSSDRGISVFKCDPSIENSLIQYNSHTSSTGGQAEEHGGGAGICLKYSNTVVKNVIVSNNGGVTLGCGIYCSDGNPKISNSIIVNNVNPNLYDIRPGGGIQCAYSANVIIENSIIFNNENSIGAGIYIMGISSFIPNVTIANCIISENMASEYGGGISFGLAEVSVQNSSVWNNEGGNFLCDDPWLGVNVTVNNNLDSCDTYGNINANPQFNDPLQKNFKLADGSPCIDAGNNVLVTSPIDFDHNFRIWDGNNDNDSIVDMGAFEFGSQLNPSDVDFHLPVNDKNVLLFPNPAKNTIYVKVQDLEKIEIYNQFGQLIIESQNSFNDISNLVTGVYIVKIYRKTSPMNYNLKLIKE